MVPLRSEARCVQIGPGVHIRKQHPAGIVRRAIGVGGLVYPETPEGAGDLAYAAEHGLLNRRLAALRVDCAERLGTPGLIEGHDDVAIPSAAESQRKQE